MIWFDMTQRSIEALHSVGCQDTENFLRFFRSYGVFGKAELGWHVAGRRAPYNWIVWSDNKTKLIDKGQIPQRDDDGNDNYVKAYELAIIAACDYIRCHPEKYEHIEERVVEASPFADYIRTSYEYRNDGNLTGLDDK